MRRISLFRVGAGRLVALPGAVAQQADTAARVASQVEALKTFAMLDGVWRGPATMTQASGSPLTFTQTERIGPSSAARSG